MPSRRARFVVAAVVATLSAAYIVGRHLDWSYHLTDLDHQLCAARVLAGGGDPYAAVGEGKPCQWGFPLYYPATALVALMPIAWMPAVAARAIFVAVGGFCLCYALTRDGWHRLPLFLSAAYYAAVSRAQWSPLLTAAVMLPWLAVFLCVKPTLGAALAVGVDTRGWRFAVAGGITLAALSLALRPSWPLEWLMVARHAPAALVAASCGPLVWVGYAALLRWREPAARVIAALISVPLTQGGYELVPLFLAPRTAAQSAAMAVATHVAGFVFLNWAPLESVDHQTRFFARWCAPMVVGVAVYAVLSPAKPAPRWVTAWLVATAALAQALTVWLPFTRS